MDTLFQDIRYGVRMLLKSPSVSIVATIALALGIGANTAIFSVVNAVLLRPLPFPNSDALTSVYKSSKDGRVIRAPLRILIFSICAHRTTCSSA
jgi:putative ABC transport system permease protein